MNSKLFSLLLRDTMVLIRPLPITTILPHDTQSTGLDTASHPHLNLILVLSDLSRVFDSVSCKSSHTVSNHIIHKLMFYVAHVLSTPSLIFCALVEEILQKNLQCEEVLDHISIIPAVKMDG